MTRRARLLSLLPAGVTALAMILPSTTATAAGESELRSGPWSTGRVPDGWSIHESEHYQVQSQIGADEARAVADHLEAMLPVYRSFLPSSRRLPTFVVKVFASQTTYATYAPNEATAVGYYDVEAKELVTYDTGIFLGERHGPRRLRLASDFPGALTELERARLDELVAATNDTYTPDLGAILSHEGWHQYFQHYTVSSVPMPSWLDEGLGDYFATARPPADGRPYELGALNADRLRVAREALLDGSTVSFERMLDFEQEDYYSDDNAYYAQGWSMVYFFLHGEDERHRELIPRLLRDFRDSKNFRESTGRIFDDYDLEELEVEWALWVLKTPADDPLRRIADELGYAVGPSDLTGPDAWLEAYARHWRRAEERASWGAVRAGPR